MYHLKAITWGEEVWLHDIFFTFTDAALHSPFLVHAARLKGRGGSGKIRCHWWGSF